MLGRLLEDTLVGLIMVFLIITTLLVNISHLVLLVITFGKSLNYSKRFWNYNPLSYR